MNHNKKILNKIQDIGQMIHEERIKNKEKYTLQYKKLLNKLLKIKNNKGDKNK